MSDPTYDREVIRKNPIWNEAFILSEVLNDNAPLGWGRYIYAAEELSRNRPSAADLLRQAIEALTNSCDLLESYIDTFGDMSGANRADLNDYRAVLTAYDKRSA